MMIPNRSNTSLAVAILAAAQALACGAVSEPGQLTDNGQPSVQASTMISPYPGLPTLRLGDGYNRIKETELLSCVTPRLGPVVNVDATLVDFATRLSATEASSALGVEAGAKARFKLWGGSASARFAKKLASSAFSLSLYYIHEAALTEQPVEMSGWVSVLDPKNTAYSQWIPQCGDSVVARIRKGGKLILNFSLDFASESDKREFEGKVSGNIGPVELAGKVTQNSSLLQNRAKVRLMVNQIGGDPTKLSNIIAGTGADGTVSPIASAALINCSITNMTPCTTVINKLMSYTGGFAKDLETRSVPLSYWLYSYEEAFGFSGYSQRFLPLEIVLARSAISAENDRMLELQERIDAISTGNMVVPAEVLARIPEYQATVNTNHAYLTYAYSACWDQILDPSSPTDVARCVDASNLGVPRNGIAYDRSKTVATLTWTVPKPPPPPPPCPAGWSRKCGDDQCYKNTSPCP